MDFLSRASGLLASLALVSCYGGIDNDSSVSDGEASSTETGDEEATSMAGSSSSTGDATTLGSGPVTTSSTGEDSSTGETDATTIEPSTTAPDPSDTSTTTGPDPTTDTATTDATTEDPTDSETDATTDATTGDPEDPVSVCERWNADRADLSVGSWSGSIDNCDPGMMAPEGLANALRVLNLYRWLADLPPVTTTPERNAGCQEAALAFAANNMFAHGIPQNWDCYTSEGSTASQNANVASADAVQSMALWMTEGPSNVERLGHRRWILGNKLGPVGIGSVSNWSCLWVIGGSGQASKPWNAWPAEGYFPLQATTSGWYSIDQTGWHVQSSSISLTNATVEVKRDGVPVEIEVFPLSGNSGWTTGVRFVPVGWNSEPDVTYSIQVTAGDEVIEYEVHMLAC